jgi:formate--tetrahydrofolate ligase
LGEADFKPLYNWDEPVKDKIEKIATRIYGAGSVNYSAQAEKDLKRIADLGLDDLPVCIAKTQNSFSDNPKLLGKPVGFEFNIREVEIAAGAGFLVPIAGNMMRMPGLPATPSAEAIDIDDNGNISGLF